MENEPEQRPAIGDIKTSKLEVRALGEGGKPPVLQADIVGVVEIINPNNRVPLLKRNLDDFRRDKPRASGNQYLHPGAAWRLHAVRLIPLILNFDEARRKAAQ